MSKYKHGKDGKHTDTEERDRISATMQSLSIIFMAIKRSVNGLGWHLDETHCEGDWFPIMPLSLCHLTSWVGAAYFSTIADIKCMD